MNHMLVAELLVEDAKLREAIKVRDAAVARRDLAAAKEADLDLLRLKNMRDLIWSEMGKTERELYKLQLDYASGLHTSVPNSNQTPKP